jgi:hypothetical protein
MNKLGKQLIGAVVVLVSLYAFCWIRYHDKMFILV